MLKLNYRHFLVSLERAFPPFLKRYMLHHQQLQNFQNSIFETNSKLKQEKASINQLDNLSNKSIKQHLDYIKQWNNLLDNKKSGNVFYKKYWVNLNKKANLTD